MPQHMGKPARTGDGSRKHGSDRSVGDDYDDGTVGHWPDSLAPPSDMGRALRNLYDAQLDRLSEAAISEVRQLSLVARYL